MTANEQTLNWEAPGPGPWEADAAHFPKPFPRFARDMLARAFREGFQESTARYGLLLSHFEIGFVNDFWYQQPVAFGAPPGAKGPPPAPILWLLTRLHPAMRKRIQIGQRALEDRIWHEDLRRWDEEDKPRATARHRALLALEPSALDDSALLRHLTDCAVHVADMLRLHHRYTMPACVPIGDFLTHVSDWTGREPGEILQLLRGSSQVSLGFSAAELEQLAEALRNDPSAAAIVESEGDSVAILEALRQAPGPAGEAARAFLDLVWHRALSYDISEKANGELPTMLLGGIRSSLHGQNQTRGSDITDKAQALRAQVPDAHKAEFDRLLGEARAVSRLRDERGMYAECWAIGIGRRALLELGRRLVALGKLESAEHGVFLEMDEAGALLRGGSQPTVAELQRRADWRATKTVADVPAWLGHAPAGPPDTALLPKAARRSARAIDAVLSNLFQESNRVSSETIVRGLSVNDESYEGIARVVNDASEFSRLRQGDVLVTRSTAPYFNVVLPLLGAIVTDRGGQLCHAAIVAREYGIPGVVGTKDATRLIPDGARVQVDGTKGEVRIVSR
jgi:phosphohistidine swiveling domain-containing protein